MSAPLLHANLLLITHSCHLESAGFFPQLAPSSPCKLLRPAVLPVHVQGCSAPLREAQQGHLVRLPQARPCKPIYELAQQRAGALQAAGAPGFAFPRLKDVQQPYKDAAV